nr:F-box domain, leucine-rich repeat domain, L domain-like protein [Tanacetum cinerariifolium]
MSPGINQLSPQLGRAESTADRVYSRAVAAAVAAETQPKDNATLHIDGQSMEVDAPPDIDVVDEDDDITDDEDTLPHDLEDSDNEDVINVDDNGVDKMSADVARSHGGDGGGEDRPLHTMYPAVAWVALLTEAEANENQIWAAGQRAAHWSSYIGEVIKGVPLYYLSWLKVPKERKAALITDIGMSADVARSYGGNGEGEDRLSPHHVPSGCMGCFANRGKGKRKPNLGGRAAGRLNTRDKTQYLSLKETTDKKGPVPIQFELLDKKTVKPLYDHAAHWSSYIGEVIRESPDWTEIDAGIQQHLQKAYNINKAAFKAQHRVIDPTTRTYNVEKIRRARPKNIMASEWDKYIQFWNDPRNIARAAQNRQNRAKSVVISRQGSRSLARLRDEMEEMRRFEATGTYTDDEINRLARGGKQRGHIPGVGRVLPARATTTQFKLGGANGSGGCGDDEEGADDQSTRMRMAMAILSCVIYGKCGTHRFAGDCRWGRNPLRAFPSEHSPATSRLGKVSPAISRRGMPGIIAGK